MPTIKPVSSWEGSDDWSSLAPGDSHTHWYKKQQERLANSDTGENGPPKCEHDRCCPLRDYLRSPRSHSMFVFVRLRIWFYHIDVANGCEGPAPKGTFWAEDPDGTSNLGWGEVNDPSLGWIVDGGLELESHTEVKDPDRNRFDPALKKKFDFVRHVTEVENDLSPRQCRNRHLFFTLPTEEKVRRLRALASELSDPVEREKSRQRDLFFTLPTEEKVRRLEALASELSDPAKCQRKSFGYNRGKANPGNKKGRAPKTSNNHRKTNGNNHKSLKPTCPNESRSAERRSRQKHGNGKINRPFTMKQ